LNHKEKIVKASEMYKWSSLILLLKIKVLVEMLNLQLM